LNSQRIATIWKCLEGLKSRPEMYIGRCDPELANVFLGGLVTGLQFWGGFDWAFYGQAMELVAKQRGWKWRPIGLVREMHERGMKDMEIIAELVTIDAEVLRQLFPPDDPEPGGSTNEPEQIA
jgi:hypothetical protein